MRNPTNKWTNTTGDISKKKCTQSIIKCQISSLGKQTKKTLVSNGILVKMGATLKKTIRTSVGEDVGGKNSWVGRSVY